MTRRRQRIVFVQMKQKPIVARMLALSKGMVRTPKTRMRRTMLILIKRTTMPMPMPMPRMLLTRLLTQVWERQERNIDEDSTETDDDAANKKIEEEEVACFSASQRRRIYYIKLTSIHSRECLFFKRRCWILRQLRVKSPKSKLTFQYFIPFYAEIIRRERTSSSSTSRITTKRNSDASYGRTQQRIVLTEGLQLLGCSSKQREVPPPY